VKKLLLISAIVAAGFAIWRKVESDRAEEAVWAAVTDDVV
jgi:hypothetical protein